jgi:hypothetical protein
VNGGAKSGALPNDLALIARFWPALSQPIKASILAIIREAGTNVKDG